MDDTILESRVECNQRFSMYVYNWIIQLQRGWMPRDLILFTAKSGKCQVAVYNWLNERGSHTRDIYAR